MWTSQMRWRCILLHYAYSLDLESVSAIMGPTVRSIRNWLRYFNAHGDVFSHKTDGRRSRYPENVLEFIKQYIENDPTFLIEELQSEMAQRFPSIKNISSSTILRALRLDLGLTRKVICKKAREASISEIKSFISRLSPFYCHPSQLVFIDETSKDSRDSLRRYGWSRKGTKCTNVVPFRRGKRVSALAALDVHGFFSWELIEGTFSRGNFFNALKYKILPLMNPYPLPRSILILDNAKIHCFPEIFELCSAFGVVVVFLPPYCPQLNPIEFAFSTLKKFLSKNCRYAFFVDPFQTMNVALRNCISHFASCFHHCGYSDEGKLDFSHYFEDINEENLDMDD